MMIQLVASPTSVNEAERLLRLGIDRLIVGDDTFGLRMNGDWNVDMVREVTRLAHRHGKEVSVAVNAMMHAPQIDALPEYLATLKEMAVDDVLVGDVGAIRLIRQFGLPYWYDAQTLVTSAKQIQFFAKRGAIGAVAARELTIEELANIQRQIGVPLDVQVYGPTCIHHSRRRLLTNFGRHLEHGERMDRRLFELVEPNDPVRRYPILEDENGTHIFLDHVSTYEQLATLFRLGLHTWRLEGWREERHFLDVVSLFADARRALLNGQFQPERMRAQMRELRRANLSSSEMTLRMERESVETS